MRLYRLFRLALVLVVALFSALVVFVSTVNLDRYRDLLEAEVKEATGRDFNIEGNIRFGLSLPLTIVLDDLSFAGSPWSSQPEMVRVKHLRAQVALLPLMSGDVQVTRAILIEPRIVLERDARGQGNWELGGKETDKEQSAQGIERSEPEVEIVEVRIENGKLTYLDGVSGQTTTLDIQSLSVKATSRVSPLTVNLTGGYNGNDFKVEGTLGALRDVLANKAIPISMRLIADGGEVTLEGSILKPLEGKGIDVTIEL